MDDKDNILLDEDFDFEPVPSTQNNDKNDNIENTSNNIFDNDGGKNLKEDINQVENTSSNENSNINNDVVIKSIFDNNEKEETTDENKKQESKIKKLDMFNGASKVLPIIAFVFVSILGVYVFINNVHADLINLIKIESNQKVGYINNEGNLIVKPKYLYGSDFYKGYAVVKNYNSLYGIINGKGSNEIAFGNIFSANLYGNRYIISKFTSDGLKMGLLDSNLKEVTKFKYDNISYSKSGIFMFTKEDTTGILNNDGKEIYTYKVDEVDDKNISVEISSLTNEETSTYAKIKVNSSSTIINIKTGKEVYKYTLDDIRVLDNNVFYIKNDEGNNTYFVIKDDKIVYETSEYKRVRIEDLSSDILIGIKEDASIDYINLLTKEKINNEGSVKYTYSDGVVLEEYYNFSTGKNEYTVLTPKKILGKFNDIKLVDDTYVNGFMKIYTSNKKYSFIDKKGNIITDKEYENVSDFNKNGYAIVSNNNQFGVIDKSGNEILNVKYDKIEFIDDTLFSNLSDKLFIYKENNKYGIINSKKKVVVKAIYDSFDVITTKYPIIKATYNDDNILVNLQTYKDLSIDSTSNVQVYEDYIVSDDNYYNYDGELIYTIGE